MGSLSIGAKEFIPQTKTTLQSKLSAAVPEFIPHDPHDIPEVPKFKPLDNQPTTKLVLHDIQPTAKFKPLDSQPLGTKTSVKKFKGKKSLLNFESASSKQMNVEKEVVNNILTPSTKGRLTPTSGLNNVNKENPFKTVSWSSIVKTTTQLEIKNNQSKSHNTLRSLANTNIGTTEDASSLRTTNNETKNLHSGEGNNKNSKLYSHIACSSEKPPPPSRNEVVVKRKLARTSGYGSNAASSKKNSAFYVGANEAANKLKNNEKQFKSARKVSLKDSTEQFRVLKVKNKLQYASDMKSTKSQLSKDSMPNWNSFITPPSSYSSILKKASAEKSKPSPNAISFKQTLSETEKNIKKKEKLEKRKLKSKQKKADHKKLDADGEVLPHPLQELKQSEKALTLDISKLFDKLIVKSRGKVPSKKKLVVSTGVVSVVPGLAKKNNHKGKRVTRNKNGTIPTILDGTVHIRKRGKERETPKRKRPTLLRKIINAERERRKKLREAADNEIIVIEEKACENNENIHQNKDIIKSKSCPDTRDECKHSEDLINKSVNEVVEEKAASINGAESDVLYKPLTRLPEDIWKKIHSRKFREYCDHVLTKDINELTNTLLNTLQRFQDRVYHETPLKYKQKRRFVLGLREVLKNLKVKKIKAIVFAPNMESVATRGGIDDYLSNILTICEENELPKIFAMNRHTLGRCVKKKAPVSVVGIFNYDGAHDTFKELMTHVEAAKVQYTERANKIMTEVTVASTLHDEKQPRPSTSSISELTPANLHYNQTAAKNTFQFNSTVSSFIPTSSVPCDADAIKIRILNSLQRIEQCNVAPNNVYQYAGSMS